MKERIVCWFSHGVASSVATAIAIKENSESENPKELVIVSIYIEEEHEDNVRFREECERWFDQKIEILTSEKYNSSVTEVIKKTRYMSGAKGARCTKELKKQVRWDWQRNNDIHVFGMTSEEVHRIDRLIDQENEINLWPILIDKGISKKQCFEIFRSSRIRLPEMYLLGYNNNNCKGCLKSQSASYWNKTRVDFPEIFNQRMIEEKLLGVSLVRMSANKFIKEYPHYFQAMLNDYVAGKFKIKINSIGALMVPLRYLPEDAGKSDSPDVPDCGFFCENE